MQEIVRVERGGAMASKPENIVVTNEFLPGLREISLQLDPVNAERFFRMFGKALGSRCPCCRDVPQVWNERDAHWNVVK